MNRRDFIKYLSAVGASSAWPAYGAEGAEFPERPNFLFILTDQERSPIHWPEGFAEERLPSWKRLRSHGLNFNRAYCSSAQCSPSRACMLTGHYSNINKVPTFDFPGGLPGRETLPNIGSWLKERGGYDSVWKGKWHLSFPQGFRGGPPDKEVWTAADIEVMETKYGFSGWNPPEAGNNIQDSPGARVTMGGGRADNDGRFVQGMTPGAAGQTKGLGESALDFLFRVGSVDPKKRKPFCLFVSLVNPHDIAYYPNGWDTGGYRLEDFENLGIGLPPNFQDDLSTKPSIQNSYLQMMEKAGPLGSEAERRRYVNFYAYLHTVVDRQINILLDAVEAAGLSRDTIIIRTADHGELGLSHGLREKSYTAYEEVIHTPLVVSNPVLFPEPRSTEAIYSHIDLAATVCDLAGAPGIGVGRSQAPVILGERESVREDALFCFDDCFFLPCDSPASHIRALRDDRYTYAVYYSADGGAFDYELYDNKADPGQLTNLLSRPATEIEGLWLSLHERLNKRLEENLAVPLGFDWPRAPIRG